MNTASLLQEPDNRLKVLALQQMLNNVDAQWSDTAESISLIESLTEDRNFPERNLASFLTAKIYYHLDNIDDALNYALQSGEYFKPEINNQFNACLTGRCIDQYIAHQQRGSGEFSLQKEQLVIQILFTSCKKQNHLSAIGIALDCRRIDLVQQIIAEWQNPQKMIQVLGLINTLQQSDFRERVLRLTVDLIYQEAQQGSLPNEEWGLFITVLVQLGEVSRVAEILYTLARQNNFKLQFGTTLQLAYQLCIDLVDNQKPQFIQRLIESLPVDQEYAYQRDRMIKILSGEITRRANLYFLKSYNKADPLYLASIKGTTDSKFSVQHGGALFGIGLALAGTQDSTFLKDNQQWATKCNYWQKFTGISTLGIIHKYNIEESQQLMALHLQPNNNQFEVGGALYALGLIHFGSRDTATLLKMQDNLKSSKEQILHGAALGLGLVSFASEDPQLSGKLIDVVEKNESVQAEGAAIGLGLLHAGSGNQQICQQLLNLAQQSDKEKISRTLSLAIACANFSQESHSDALIETMLRDIDPFVRYGGCFTLAMAYVGTASNKAIQRLLQIAVEDVSDDVRRAAVIAFGFLLFKHYEQAPKVVRLLILSYNPHIRYGTAIALGIACAGTMYVDAINMLEPMLSDNVDFVRQGALIALSMILSHANASIEPKYEQIVKLVSEIQAKKHETVLVKLGLSISQGLNEVGGRNLVVNLQSRQGFPKLESVIGMLWFTNYWFWFPCLSFISLTLQPAALIAVNETLQVPKDYLLQCNSKQSVFDYPLPLKPDEKKVTEKKQVQLSTTNKVAARRTRKDQEKGEMNSIPVSRHESKISIEHQQSGALRQTSAIIEEKPEEKKKEEKEEAQYYILHNPCRILEKQKKHIQFLEGNRYTQLLKDRKQGLVVLVDSTPNVFCDALHLYPVQNIPAHALPENQVPDEFVYDEPQQ